MLGTLLAWETFKNKLTGSLWITFQDNIGVLLALIKGGSNGPEVNLLVGQLWLVLAGARTSFWAARVESKANLADGPTREDLSELEFLGAQYVEPCLPAWSENLWKIPVAGEPIA